MARRGSRALAVVLAVGAVCAGVAGEAAHAERLDVNATISFARKSGEFTKIRLAITRNGKTWRSGPLGTSFFSRPRLYVRDLDADGELEVRVDSYTGGAHCCFQTRFFRWLPERKAYGMTFRNWADAGYRAVNLDGRGAVELLSGDARFGYVFTAFAGSPFPIQIWEFDGGRLRDVTQLFPGQVELDAKRLWGTYLEHRRTDDVRGVLAAWQADQYLLEPRGRRLAGARASPRRAATSGGRTAPGRRARRYLRALRAFLVKTGYV